MEAHSLVYLGWGVGAVVLPVTTNLEREGLTLFHRHLLEASIAQAECLVVSGVKDFVGMFHQHKENVNEEEGLCNKSIPITWVIG